MRVATSFCCMLVSFLGVSIAEDRAAVAACSRSDCLTVDANVAVGGTNESSVAINPVDPSNFVVSYNFGIAPSLDDGATWMPMSPIPLVDPNVAFDATGVAYWQGLVLANPRDLRVARSIDGGQSWAPAVLAYAPTPGNGNPDQGVMAVDTSSDSPHLDNVYVVFSDYPVNPQPGRVGFSLMFTRSSDGGLTFSAPIDISDSPSGGQEHSAGIATGPDGEIYVVWMDLGDNVILDKSLDGGLTWGVDGVIRPPPPTVNAFPQSDDVRGNPTVTVDRSDGPFRGSVYVTSIDRNAASGGAADAWVIHSRDGGMTWSSDVLLSDGPAGPYRYYFQPRIIVAPNGRLDATWYDTRFNASSDINNIAYDVFYTYSIDGGVTFAPSARVTDLSSLKLTNCPTQAPCGDRRLYEYTGLASENGRAVATWTDFRTGFERISIGQLNLPPTASPCETASVRGSRLTLRNVGSAQARLNWTWKSAGAVSKDTFGDPVLDSDFVLAVYDQAGSMLTTQVSAEAPAGDICGTRPCWSEKPTGFLYADGQRTPDGLSRVMLKAGAAGKARIAITGMGANLQLPAQTLTLPATVELRRSDSSRCWRATFSQARRNDGVVFIATSD